MDSHSSLPSDFPLTYSEIASFEPVQYLLQSMPMEGYELVYENRSPHIEVGKKNVLIVFGASGEGKDAVIAPLVDDGTLVHAVTAVSRKRRVAEGEEVHKYVWMREKRDEESKEEYCKHLISEYDLIEYDEHFGAFYGLPRKSLMEALDRGLPVIRTESNGVRTILKAIGDTYNCIVVFVCPESFGLVWERVRNRENPVDRITKAVEVVREAPEIAHYFLLNPVEYHGKPGLSLAIANLRKLIERVVLT